MYISDAMPLPILISILVMRSTATPDPSMLSRTEDLRQKFPQASALQETDEAEREEDEDEEEDHVSRMAQEDGNDKSKLLRREHTQLSPQSGISDRRAITQAVPQPDNDRAVDEAVAKIISNNYDGSSEVTMGKPSCRCIAVDPGVRNIEDQNGNVIKTLVNIGGYEVEYPAGVGATCESWDSAVSGKWCYVDPCQCAGVPAPQRSVYMPEVKYRGNHLYYSRATCGGQDWINWRGGDGNPGKMDRPCSAYLEETPCRAKDSCSWSGAACLDKGSDLERMCQQHPVYGKPECPCIEAKLSLMGQKVQFGGRCRAWYSDWNLNDCKPGHNNGDKACNAPFCVIDPCKCDLDRSPSLITVGATNAATYISYATCASSYNIGDVCKAQTTQPNCDAQTACYWDGSTCTKRKTKQFFKDMCESKANCFGDAFIGKYCNNRHSLQAANHVTEEECRQICNGMGTCQGIDYYPKWKGGHCQPFSNSDCNPLKTSSEAYKNSVHQMVIPCGIQASEATCKCKQAYPYCHDGYCYKDATVAEFDEESCGYGGTPHCSAAATEAPSASKDLPVTQQSATRRKGARPTGGVRNGCAPPADIDGANNVSSCVEEGSVIKESEWCTPSCEGNKMAWVDVSGVPLPSACFEDADDTAEWGAKLCCANGQLHPPTFKCVPDEFTLMDANGDGAISELEHKMWMLKAAGRTTEAEELKSSEGLKKVVEETGKSKAADDDSYNPIVLAYLIAVTIVAVGGAFYVIYTVVTMGSTNATPPPTTAMETKTVEGAPEALKQPEVAEPPEALKQPEGAEPPPEALKQTEAPTPA